VTVPDRSGVLVVTVEPVARRMAGPGIRALELARAVARDGRGGPVTVASLGAVDRTDPAVVVVAVASEGDLRALVARAAVVVVQGDVLGLHRWMVDADVPVVVDAYDPYHLEQLEQARPLGETGRRAVVRDCVSSLDLQLSRADLVLCASPRQRDLWTGHLAALGRVNPVTYDRSHDLSALIAVVPFGVSAEPAPDRDRGVLRAAFPSIGDDDVVLLWGGGVYDWFDPVTLVHAVAAALPSAPRLRLVFLGTRHPVAGEAAAVGAARRAAVETGTLDRTVFFHEGWVPYDERGRWLSAADVGVSTHHDHLETRFSFRTRLLDYLWCGLPVVATAGDDLADEMARSGAALTVPADDLAGLTAALVSVGGDADWRARAGAAASSLAEQYAWDRVAVPLADFSARPTRSPDLVLDAVSRVQLGLRGPGDRRRGHPLDRVRALWREGGADLFRRRLIDRARRAGGARRAS
jgi:glycosyltransferase involved in cell wall biosynthesis